MILKLNINFTGIKALFFLGDVDIEKVLATSNISSDEKSCKYFIDYLCDNYKIKSLHIMVPKTIAYVRCYDGQTKWMYFLIKDDDFWKNIILFEIISALILIKNLIANLSTIKR